ncbi:MAG: hypothetical protein AB1646_23535 [Thermodesulfobacteriota bacterium]
MKTPRNCIIPVAGGLLFLLLWVGCCHTEEVIYAPEYLWKRGIDKKTNPIDIANTHLGIPYRNDGALDEHGQFTTFDRPDRQFAAPGLNCSGLVLSVCRFLFNKNWTLAEATRDRMGDSGDRSKLGKDWDFGWDLILNLTEGTPRRVIMPDGKDYPIEKADGASLRGFDLHDEAAWKRVLSQVKPGRVYLATVSKPGARNGYKWLHYHVALMLPDQEGGVWLYHATRLSRTHSMNLRTREGLHRFLWELRRTHQEPKHILIVESPLLPETTVASAHGNPGPTPAAGPSAAKGNGGDPRRAEIELLDTLGTGQKPPNTSDQQQPTPSHTPKPKADEGPDLVINHLSGKVFASYPLLSTHIPKFVDDRKESVAFWFRNEGDAARELDVLLEGPAGKQQLRSRIQPGGKDLTLKFPEDFKGRNGRALAQGRYKLEVKVDGKRWCANIFEVARPREALPKLVGVKVPDTVNNGQTFTLQVVAENQGAESDYGGITVSCPDASALRIEAAKPGKVFGKGSTVLSVTTDRIRTSVPMAEQWIELWGEQKRYEMAVRIKALRSGTFPIYVRCAIRGVNVRSSVVLMDPPGGEVVDQQGFPVYVHKITVR